MSSGKNMLSTFLLPIDNMELFQGTAALVGSMSRVLGGKVQKMTLVHAIEGSYLAKHMENIDHRVEHVLSSDLIKKLRAEYISNTVEPELKAAVELLKEKGVTAPVDTVVADGAPADVVADMTSGDGYSTIVMQRRGLTGISGMLMGSVTEKILHRDIDASIYLTGTTPESQDCNRANILVAIDDSDHSRAALEEASLLLGKCAEINQVVLASVTDAAAYSAAVEDGRSPEEETLALLDGAASFLEESGVPSDRIEKVARYGKGVAEALEEEIKNRKVGMVFMGRRGRSTIAELFIGSVSKKIIACCPEQTIAVITA